MVPKIEFSLFIFSWIYAWILRINFLRKNLPFWYKNMMTLLHFVALYGVILASVPPYLSLSTLAGLSCGWGIISISGLIFTSCCFREIWLNRRHTFEFTIGAPRSYCQAQPSSIQNQLSWLGWVSFNSNFCPPTHPQGKYWEGNSNTVIGQTSNVGLRVHTSLMTSVPVVN